MGVRAGEGNFVIGCADFHGNGGIFRWAVRAGNGYNPPLKRVIVMQDPLLLLLTLLRALVEVAGLSLLGQGIVGLLAGRRREENFVYRIFQVITRPAIRIVRTLLPAAVIDRHVPYVTFFVLLWLWLALAYLKRLFAT